MSSAACFVSLAKVSFWGQIDASGCAGWRVKGREMRRIVLSEHAAANTAACLAFVAGEPGCSQAVMAAAAIGPRVMEVASSITSKVFAVKSANRGLSFALAGSGPARY